jgi:DNA mismatch repair protein MutS
VLGRANEVLSELERADNRTKPADLVGDLPLFSAARAASPEPPKPSPLEAAIEALRPDAMTPRQALEAIYTLKGLLDRATGP